MEVDVVALLRELDVAISEGTTDRSWLLRSPTGEPVLVEPILPVDRITSHAVRNISSHRRSPASPLFVGRTITPNMLEQAKAGNFDVLTERPLQLVLRGSVYAGEETAPAPARRRPSGRAAWVRWAVGRCLLLSSEPLRQPAIAELLGTSQQSVSNAARQLGDLVADAGSGLSAANKARLLEHWVEEYPGSSGPEFGWYSLDPIVEQTLQAAKVAELLDARPLISGDVAADRLAPWKLPSRGRIYVNSPIDLGGDGFVPAPADEATLITCVPRDPTLWRLAQATPCPESGAPALADAAIVYWDVLASGEIDSVEAAGHLKELIIGSKQ
ncbi:type IV toxin-antitoxin system AbiEi family antitoxin [Paeniglutamicibacter sp.]|uniref:type IV toxin-antitoxin system AbiEi family antitoxin n=1 Tax=Paeniglutamicibacter sp. TaxID=1934391 RepID=UPI0039896ABB